MHSLDTHSQHGGAAQALHRRNSSLLKWPRISHPRLELGRWRQSCSSWCGALTPGLYALVNSRIMFQCIKCSISICHLQNLYQVWFISILRRESSSAEIATPQMTFCARASSDQLHLHWIQSLSAKLQRNMWPVDHGRMQSIISCVSFPNLGWLVFLRNRVSAIWACAWPGHIWAAAVRTRLAPALSCPPLTLSMNCLPAYSSMLSLIHTPICLI